MTTRPPLTFQAASRALLAGAALLVAGPLRAQGPSFSTPGMPGAGTPGTPASMGQTTRFSTDFNPALGFVIDTVFDYASADDAALDDGFDASLRLVEFNGAAFIDPNAWAWVSLVVEESELELEEAAIQYIGMPGNMGLRGGRFFVDFGKQMQAHLEELRTIERPAVLRTYLGDELAGDGLQFDDWHPVGDTTAVRYSLGVFGDLVAAEVEDDAAEPLAAVAARKDFGELNFTGRLTGFTDVGENGMFQLGASGQFVPSYSVSDPGGTAPDVEDLERAVYGVDATYGWTGAEGNRRLTLGAEYLIADGDLGAELAGPTIDVFDGSAAGYYAFADYSWEPQSSAGIQYSALELPRAGTPELAELDLYYTRALSEFQRLRFQITRGDDEDAGDYLRFAIQWTAFFGNHAHGFNW